MEELGSSMDMSFVMIWTLVAAFMVFLMQAGFAMLEAGLVRARNVCNIMMKNVMDFSIGSLAYFFVGFGLMFGTASAGGWVGTSLFSLQFPETVDENWGVTFWFFQAVFAATACTITSGAMAERTKFTGYLCYSFLISLFLYPIFGKWAWGSLLMEDGAGWLENLGFADFAGSTVVHSVGGWAALAGAMVVGPRLGKYARGRVNVIPGHSMPLAALGVFILWFGWFGFNSGSTTDGADRSIGMICAATALSAAAGAIAAMFASWFSFGKPDTGMTLNGVLAGLVGITAGCDVIGLPAAVLTGLVAGALVVGSIVVIDKRLKIDDPVGAISVHGVCGVWGTLAVGLFGGASLGIQALGCLAAFLWTFPIAFVLFLVLKKAGLLRVSEEEEMLGLDLSEHGNEGYPGHSIGEGMAFPSGSMLPRQGLARQQ